MGIQKQLLMKTKGSIDIFLTVRPTSWWDSWLKDVVNPF